MNNVSRTILGIDPGTTVMGYGIISVNNNKVEVLTLGVLKLNKLTNHYDRLEKIYSRVVSLVTEFSITEFAIEAPFFGENVQSMLKLGRAQGVCIAAAMSHKVPVTEYAPRKIKMSITGNGNASKEQVADMLTKIVKFESDSKFFDATDALAVAICHFHNSKLPEKGKSFSGWEDFIRKNPNRASGIK